MPQLKKLAGAVFMFLSCWGLLAPAAPQAASLDAMIVVDNAFNFFLGDLTGSNLRFIGSGTDWQHPQPITDVVCQPGDYLYVAGWDLGGPQMFLAQFTLPGGTLLTNTGDWLAYQSTNPNPQSLGSTLLSLSQIEGDIAAANLAAAWTTPADLGFNDGSSGIWGGPLAGIDTAAHFIWHPGDNLTDANYVLFRSAEAVCPIPIPAALPLFGSGLVLVGAWRARRTFC